VRSREDDHLGIVRVNAELASRTGGFRSVEFLADTGSLYTLITPRLAQELGMDFATSTTLETANNSRSEVPLGFGRVRVMGREEPIIVGAMEVPMPLLGSTALQALGLKVNPSEAIVEFAAPYPPLA
jgi:predicted aspartyl protease